MAIVLQLGGTSSEALDMLRGLSPRIWAAFAALYLAQPIADLAIFRRLWRLPISGFKALLRKFVINEIVFGYSGEVYFYLWARRRTELARAPFDAIKDVNILSGLMGNLLTLVMLAISAPSLQDLHFAEQLRPAFWPGLVLVGLSVGVLLFAPRVFSLRLSELAFVVAVHVGRLAATSGLMVMVWALALPDVPMQAWLVLLAIRLLVSRIPFLTNKDLVFGNLVLILVGSRAPVGVLLATLALATLIAHLGTIALLGSGDLLRAMRRQDAKGSREERRLG